jgi:diguanylate cyclase (GGDEF)-like protein/PAS domain S-box-containing protein
MRNLLVDPAQRVFFKDRESRFVLVSTGFADALGGGLSAEELVGKSDFDIFTAPHATAAYEDEQRVMRTGEPMFDQVERETFRDRPDAWVSTTKLPLRDDAGNIVGSWGVSRDITAQRQAEEALVYQSLHDALTGLPNRVLLIDRAEQMLARARRYGTPVAALYLDIDGFKQINDRFGHAAGDELLQVFAMRLKDTLREADTAGRLGGDEFVVLLENFSMMAKPEMVAERLCQVLAQPIELDSIEGRPVSVTTSVGIATGGRACADELLRDADFALYAAKTAGKNRWVAFESQMQVAVHDRIELEMDLSRALEQEQFFLLYQPTFDLDSGRVTGVEALLRWQHPTRGVIPPDRFIPIAEATGLIVPIGSWVLRAACGQAVAWRDAGRALDVSVNISARQLDEEDFVDEVSTVLSETGLDPASLTLEITETALMRDAGAAARRLGELKALGVRIAIDDFGTGYSSLAYLRQFPVDAIKIDRSFISGVAAHRESRALIHTLVQLGKTLGLETLGEGIEDDAQLQSLRREQCDQGQGFLLARPLDPAGIERFLANAEAAESAVA